MISDNSTVDTAFSATLTPGFLTVAEFATLAGTTVPNTTAGTIPIQGTISNPSTGYIALGGQDEITFSAGGVGSSNDGATYQAFGIIPCVSATDVGKMVVTGYQRVLLAAGAITLGAATLTAAGVAALAGGTGLSASDLLADTLTNTITNANVVVLSQALDIGAAAIRVRCPGAVGIQIVTKKGTPTSVYTFGMRTQGLALRGN